MRRNGLDNTHVGDTSTLMDDFKMLFECRRGCWWQFQRHQLLLLHKSSLQVPRASLENPIFKFPVFVVSPSKRRGWLQEPSWCSFSCFCTQVLHDSRLQSVISSFHRAFELSGLNPGVMRRFCLAALRLSVVFIQLNDASQALSALQAEDRITAIFFFSDLPPSLLVIQHLLYHTNNSIITVQRQSRRERQAAPNGLLSPMLLCVMGNAALVGCSMYTLSSPVVKTELTLWEVDVRIMM